MDPMKHFIRKTRAHRAACLIYVGSVIVLLAINFWFAVTEKHLSCFQLVVDFVAPFLILSPVYGIVWKHNLLAKLLLDHLPSTKVYALFIPAVASCLIVFLTNTPFANLIIPVLGILVIALTPYVLVSKCNSAIAIVVEGVLFILLASMLGGTTSIIVFFTTTIVLLYSLEKLNWYYSSERHVYAATRLAIISFCLILSVIISFDNNPITKALVASYFRSPANTEVPDLFAKVGWLLIIPIITLNLSGIYIIRKKHSIQYYLAVSFLSLISVFSFGYLLNCFGFFYLSFNGLAPFISGGFMHNMTFLCISSIILPPKQVNVISHKDECTSSGFSKDDVEAVVQEVITAVNSKPDTHSN